MAKHITSDLKKEKGASMVEYALTVALLAIVVVGGARAVGMAASSAFNKSTAGVEGCTGGEEYIGGACLVLPPNPM